MASIQGDWLTSGLHLIPRLPTSHCRMQAAQRCFEGRTLNWGGGTIIPRPHLTYKTLLCVPNREREKRNGKQTKRIGVSDLTLPPLSQGSRPDMDVSRWFPQYISAPAGLLLRELLASPSILVRISRVNCCNKQTTPSVRG